MNCSQQLYYCWHSQEFDRRRAYKSFEDVGEEEREGEPIEIPPHFVLSIWRRCSHPPVGWNKTNQRQQQHLFTSHSCLCFTFTGCRSPACATSGQIVLQGHLNSKFRSHGHFRKGLIYCLYLTGGRNVAQDTEIAHSKLGAE